jgi:hypothetical protein
LIGCLSLQKICAKPALPARRSVGIPPALRRSFGGRATLPAEALAKVGLPASGYAEASPDELHSPAKLQRSRTAWKETFARKLVRLREANASLRRMRAGTPAVHVVCLHVPVSGNLQGGNALFRNVKYLI